MKKLYFCMVMILTGISQLAAQDIIVKRNGEELKTKVEEIGDTQIKYRKYENPQGVLYSIPASEVFLIKFEDGTREIITPLDHPPVSATGTPTTTGTQAAANSNYANIDRLVSETKEPFRDKYFYIGPRLEFGTVSLSSEKYISVSGMLSSIGVIAEYMFDRNSPYGIGAGLTYDMYTLSGGGADLDLDNVNIDLYMSYRPRGQWNLFGGFKLGIPVKSEISGVDVAEMTNTTLGAEVGGGWATQHFDLGAGFFANYIDTFDSVGENKMIGIKLRIAYRF